MVDAQKTSQWQKAVLWYGLAALACISVAILNGGSLYYYDTAGYLEQGQSLLSSLGLFSDVGGVATGAEGSADTSSDDGVVIGSRSAIYSTLVTLAYFTAGIDTVVLVHTLVMMLAIWLPARIATRLFAPDWSVSAITSIVILAGCLGALPFYTAYLMPDIFAPVLVLSVATLAIFSREMTAFEIALVLGLSLAAVVVHPSHLLMAGIGRSDCCRRICREADLCRCGQNRKILRSCVSPVSDGPHYSGRTRSGGVGR